MFSGTTDVCNVTSVCCAKNCLYSSAVAMLVYCITQNVQFTTSAWFGNFYCACVCYAEVSICGITLFCLAETSPKFECTV